MFWSLLRAASLCQRSFSTNSVLRLQNSRYSGFLSSRLGGISIKDLYGPQRRMICFRCFKQLDVANAYTFIHQDISLKLFPSLLRGETRRFAGTRVDYKRSSAFNARNRTTAIYVIAVAITVVGFSYLAVPLYRLFCQVSSGMY